MGAPHDWAERVAAAGGHVGIANDRLHQESIPDAERCEWCEGTGNELYAMYRCCPKCGGSGRKRDEVGGS